MSNETKGITVKIDAALHAEVKKYLEEHNMTMGEFVTLALDDELHPKIQNTEEKSVEKMRTLAFQVPEDLFQRIKGYLARTGMTQKNFVIGLIEEELDRDEEMRAAAQRTEAETDTEEYGEDDAPNESDEDIATASPEAPESKSESYGEGSEDPIYMEENSEPDAGEADDLAYADDTEDAEEYDAPELSDSDDEPDYDAGEADDPAYADDKEDADEYSEDEESDDEYDDEDPEDEEYDEDGDSEEYDDADDSEDYGDADIAEDYYVDRDEGYEGDVFDDDDEFDRDDYDGDPDDEEDNETEDEDEEETHSSAFAMSM